MGYLESNQADDIDQYTFDVIINEATNLLSTVTLDDTYRYDTLTISGSGDSSSASVVNVDHVILRTDFSGLSNNQYLAFTVSIDSATNNGVFDVRRYDDICASSTPSIISECSGLSDGESCTFIYDPCLSDIYGLDNNVYIFELESPGGNYTYTFDVEVRSISFIDTSATRLTPGGVMSYSADKEISENTWHFYQFTVTENDGYSTLDFAISTSCIQSGDALEIYASFVYTDGTDTHLEIVTPKRFPTADCNAQSSTASTTFSEFFDTCKMVAGTYQIGIYAPEDIDLVDETTFPTVTRSVQYTISAALETADYVLAVPGCPLTLTGDFTRRIELRMDAVPALSRVIFGLTDNDDDDSISDFTLRYGLTAPEGTADECTLDDSIIIPDSGSNSVVISACDLEVETIYFYVVGDFDDSDDSITFFSEIEYNYPVQLPSGADFVHSAVLPSRSTFVQADVPASELTTALTRYTQYYRYELASATTVSFTNAACSSCSFDVEIIDPDFNCDFNCPTTACASGVCNVSPCDYSSDYIYFAVTRNDAIPTDAATDANCTITVESVALFSSLTNARTLVDEVTQCEPVACEQLYQISGSDATRRISTETVTIDTDVDLTIYIGDDLSCPTVDSCTAGNTCTYTISTNCVLVDYIYVVVDDCSTCALRDALYSIVYNIDSSSATTLSTGSSLSATASLVEVSTPANSFGIYSTPSGASVSYYENDADTCTTTCNVVLTPSDPSTATAFEFSNPPAGFQVNTVSTTSLSGSRSVTFDEAGFEYFAYTVPSGVRRVTFNFDNVETTAQTVPTIRYMVNVGSPVAPAPSCGTVCSSFNALSAGTCANYGSITQDVCEGDIVYLTIGLCSDVVCGVTMDVSVEFDTSSSFAPISDRSHTAAWTTISNEASSAYDCNAAEIDNTVNFSVEVEDILFVALREARSYGGATASVSVSQCGGSASTCGVAQLPAGLSTTGANDYSCAVEDRSCLTGYCVAPGTHDVTINAPAGVPSTVEYQVVNQWVSLTGSASGSLRGREAHFYEITNANQALSIVLTVQSGPAVEFMVMEGWDLSNNGARFQETKTCAYGDCPIWISTSTESPRASSLYVVIDSQSISSGRFENDLLAKDTTYQISVTRGSANCCAAPSSGFCADASSGSVNVFSSASNGQVWSFSNVTAKNNEAECYYNGIISGTCSVYTQTCRNYIKTLACLTVFPQCDASGYQMSVCNDVCVGAIAACGDDAALLNTLGCGSDRFAMNNNGTCVTNALASVTAATSTTAQSRVSISGASDAALPQQLVVPQFAPIYATMPTLVLDDDDAAGAKLLENFNEVKAESSGASVLVASLLMLLVLLF